MTTVWKQAARYILASEGELGRLLFSAASGLSSISNQLQTLKDSCATIYAPRSTKTELADLKKKLQDLKAKLRDVDMHAGAYEKLRKNVLQAKEAYQAAEQAFLLNQKQGEQLRALFNAHKEWQRLQRCEAEIALLPLTPELPAEWYEDAPQLERQQRDITVQQNGLSGDIAKLQEKLASYHIDDALLALADDINSVSEAYSIYRNSLNDVAAQQEYDSQTTQLQQLQQALGPGSANVESLLIPAPQIAAFV